MLQNVGRWENGTDNMAVTKSQGSSTEEALRIAKEKGILRPRDLEEQGIPRRYAALLAHLGHIRRVGRGLYLHPDTAV